MPKVNPDRRLAYQRKMKSEGRCVNCGQEAYDAYRCVRCYLQIKLVKARIFKRASESSKLKIARRDNLMMYLGGRLWSLRRGEGSAVKDFWAAMTVAVDKNRELKLQLRDIEKYHLAKLILRLERSAAKRPVNER